MFVRRGDLYCYLGLATQQERNWLQSYLTFKVSSFVRRRGRTKHVMKKVHLFEIDEDRFPAGLLPLVHKKARQKGIQLRVIDGRSAALPKDPDADLGWLRDYQRGAVEAALRRERGILRLPTGAGKTEILIGLMRALPGPWVFMAHRKDLMYQAAERFLLRLREHAEDPDALDTVERLGGVHVGFCGDGKHDVLGPDGEAPQFICTTFQTLRRPNGPAIKNFARARGIVIDECHTLPADSHYKVAMRFERARYRIGLSATPLQRGDKKSIYAISCLGPVIYSVKTEALIDRGVLAKPKIRMVPVEQDVAKPTWQGAYGAGVVRSTVRNKAIAQLAKIAKKPCLIFIKETKHGQLLTDRLQKEGLGAEFVYGRHSTGRRRAIVERLRHGDIEVGVCSVIFQEGIDIPELRSVIVACGGKSIIGALQRIGRGMRKADGKDTFEVFDIFDRGNKWLEEHAKKRAKAYAKEGHTVVVEKGIPLL